MGESADRFRTSVAAPPRPRFVRSRTHVSRGTLALLLAAHASARPNLAPIGYNELVARLGVGNVPTGEGIVIQQVEASAMAGVNAYLPDASRPEFAGVTFLAQTQPAAISPHAGLVGLYMYGSLAVSPGVTTVYCWLADDWLAGGALRADQGPAFPPLPTPGGARVCNHSWIGTFSNNALDSEAMRRSDFLAARDNLLVCEALGTNPGLLLGNSYNGLCVSVAASPTGGYLTPAWLDGPGRTKPDLVAPPLSRSEATAITSGVGAVLAQVADSLHSAPSATRAEVLKACILAGCVHRSTWSNWAQTSGAMRGVATRPLDPMFGADTLNIDRAHLVLTGDQHAAGSEPANLAPAPRAAWDLVSVPAGQNRYYRFSLSSTVSEALFIATWNRRVAADFASSTSADFDLELFRLDDNNSLVSLVGDPGLPYFTGGNIASRSAVDNIEHLRVLNLAPGEYALALNRRDSLPGEPWDAAVAWILPPQTCPGDANGDNLVNFIDLNIVLSFFGQTATPRAIPGDLNNDGRVDFEDLNIVLSFFGTAC